MEIENLPEEIQKLEDDNGTLLKKKVKKSKDPSAPKKVLTDGQKKALIAMNDARTKKMEEKLKIKYLKILEREQAVALSKSQPKTRPKAQPKVEPEYESDLSSSSSGSGSSSSSEEVQIISRPRRIKTATKPKKKKKIIVMEESSSESEPEVVYKSRSMKSQQNRRSLIQQHNENQTQKNFFCN